MKDYQQRVIDEKAALDEKIKKLGDFLASETFLSVVKDSEEQARLGRQIVHMAGYSGVLDQRIAAFK